MPGHRSERPMSERRHSSSGGRGRRSCTPPSCARSRRPPRMPATRRSCCPTGPSRASSAASARRTRCARPRWVRCRPARACCCGCCPTATCTSRRRRGRASWSTRACPVGHWRSSWSPQMPAPLVRICGATPIADALIDICGTWLRRGTATAGVDMAGSTAVVIASHGGPEAETIRAALDAGVGYIGLVASRIRGAAVLADARARRRASAPACTRRSDWRSAPRPPPRSRCRSSPR